MKASTPPIKSKISKSRSPLFYVHYKKEFTSVELDKSKPFCEAFEFLKKRKPCVYALKDGLEYAFDNITVSSKSKKALDEFGVKNKNVLDASDGDKVVEDLGEDEIKVMVMVTPSK